MAVNSTVLVHHESKLFDLFNNDPHVEHWDDRISVGDRIRATGAAVLLHIDDEERIPLLAPA